MNPRLATLISLIVILAALRLFPHPPNIAPIAAMALFAGAHFDDRRLALLVPLVAMLISDIVLGLHSSMFLVYLAFMGTVAIGFWVKRNRSVLNITCAALISSMLFFLLTNFGAWMSLDIYPKTIEGLGAAYAAGIPFFRNTLVGDLGYTFILFAGFWLLERSIPSVRSPLLARKP